MGHFTVLQERQCKYNVTTRRVRATIFTAEKSNKY